MNMAFSMTTEQVRNRTKTVTRRNGWEDVEVGQVIQAIVKGMGLKKGEKVERICDIRVVGKRREPLNHITDEDCVLEGFPHLSPLDFVDMYRRANKCQPDKIVTRIEFEYL
jgi:hypothetical protein